MPLLYGRRADDLTLDVAQWAAIDGAAAGTVEVPAGAYTSPLFSST